MTGIDRYIKANFHALMGELNTRMSSRTAYTTWLERWHRPNLEVSAYEDLYMDTCYAVRQYIGVLPRGKEIHIGSMDEIAERTIYTLSMSPQESMSLATLASSLEAVCVERYKDYEENINWYSQLVYELRRVGIFNYHITTSGHPVITPNLQVKGELREELDDKFQSALPQIGGVVGDMLGDQILPQLHFSGKSYRRQIDLNNKDLEAITLVSQQSYKVDRAILDNMSYHVPTITETGEILTDQQREDAREAYYRFQEMAELADDYKTVIQFPTTQDSRGRFYNAATDPAVRLTLRSVKYEGRLTEAEEQHLWSTI